MTAATTDPPGGTDLDALADAITYGILLAAFAELGCTDLAFAAAFAAVALSDAFEDEVPTDRNYPGRLRPVTAYGAGPGGQDNEQETP